MVTADIKMQTKNAHQAADKGKAWCTADENINEPTHYGSQGVFLKRKKTIKIFHNDSGIILLDSQRTLGQYITDFFFIPVLLTAMSIIGKPWSQPWCSTGD